MPTIATLHDAADQLRQISAQVEQLLDVTEPLEDARHDRWAAIVGPNEDEGALAALEAETGWEAFWCAAYALTELLDNVDRGARERIAVPA